MQTSYVQNGSNLLSLIRQMRQNCYQDKANGLHCKLAGFEVMPFSHFDCDSTANYAFQFFCASRSLSAFVLKSQTKIFFNLFKKFFNLHRSLRGVALESPRVRSDNAVKVKESAGRLWQMACTKTALRNILSVTKMM